MHACAAGNIAPCAHVNKCIHVTWPCRQPCWTSLHAVSLLTNWKQCQCNFQSNRKTIHTFPTRGLFLYVCINAECPSSHRPEYRVKLTACSQLLQCPSNFQLSVLLHWTLRHLVRLESLLINIGKCCVDCRSVNGWWVTCTTHKPPRIHGRHTIISSMESHSATVDVHPQGLLGTSRWYLIIVTK